MIRGLGYNKIYKGINEHYLMSQTKNEIFSSIKRYIEAQKPPEFIPGKTYVRYSGQVLGPEEYLAQVDTVLDGWFGLGKKGSDFEKEIADYIGVGGGLFVNSGSSANLLTVSALKSEKLGESRLKDEDEIIVGACCFPTTVFPIFQNG